MSGRPPLASPPPSRQDVALSIFPLQTPSSSAAPPPPPPPPPPPLPESRRKELLKYGVPLYQAALEGDWETAEQILKESPDWVRKPIAKRGEGVLHIAAAAKHTHFVKQLVALMTADDLALRNDANNTALCLAATAGVVEIAEVMVRKNSDLADARGSQGMTPLHMAVLLRRRKMVRYLLDVTDDNRLKDADRINILTSSIDGDLFDVAIDILNKHPELAVLRNGKNETALHALARKPLNSQRYYQKRTWTMLSGLGNILAGKQSSSESPHELLLVQRLWEEVIKEDEDTISKLIGSPWRLLFVAAQCGNVKFLTTLIRSYPDLLWKVNEENCSIFHIAIKHRHEEIFKLIHELGAIKDLIAIDKDADGNNMLHLVGSLPPSERLNFISGAALQMQRELLWFEAVENVVSLDYAEAKNKNYKTPRALFTESHEQLRAKGEEWMKKTADSCALVASLTATMVFSAAFQLPGGTNTENGAPVLLVDQPLFMVFAVCNAISLFSSSASILVFLSILTSRYAECDFLRSLPLKLMFGLTTLFISITTMVAAFTTTFFLTFRKGVRWIPIPIAVLASVPIALFATQQFPLLIDIYISTYRSRSLFRHSQQKLFRKMERRS